MKTILLTILWFLWFKAKEIGLFISIVIAIFAIGYIPTSIIAVEEIGTVMFYISCFCFGLISTGVLGLLFLLFLTTVKWIKTNWKKAKEIANKNK